MVGITGDLQNLFDKFPTPGDNYKSPTYPLGMRWGFVGNCAEHVEEKKVRAKRGVK